LSGRIALDRKRNVVGCARELEELPRGYIMDDTTHAEFTTQL
jgi:hypothetical protein